MKKLVITLLAFLTIFSFTACTSNNKNYKEYQPTQGSMFTCVEQYEDPYLGYVKVLVDKNTRVMYIYYTTNRNNDNSTGGMIVIYDTEGKPKKYEGVISD